jgi:hypothetical protein
MPSTSGGPPLVPSSAWRKELVADLGGETALSAQQRALVDAVVRTRLFLEHLDAWLLGGSPRNVRRPFG